MTKRSFYTIVIVVVVVGIVITVLLTKCNSSPKATPTPTNPPALVATPLPVKCDPINISNDGGQTVLTLPDGSQIYLAENTEIEITPAGYCPGLDEHQIMLKQGQVAVNSLLPAGKSIVFTNPNGNVAKVSETALVTFDVEANIFTLDCTNGTCVLGEDASKLTSVGCGETAFLDIYGNFNGPFNVDPSTLLQYGDWLQPKCLPARTSTPKPVTATPTLTPTPTVNIGATATAYCRSFSSQFALTPCPTLNPLRTPSLTATP